MGRAALFFRLAGAEPDVRPIAMNQSEILREPQQTPVAPSNLEGRNRDERRTGIAGMVNGNVCGKTSGIGKEEAAKALNFDGSRCGLLQRFDDGTPGEGPIGGQQQKICRDKPEKDEKRDTQPFGFG